MAALANSELAHVPTIQDQHVYVYTSRIWRTTPKDGPISVIEYVLKPARMYEEVDDRFHLAVWRRDLTSE